MKKLLLITVIMLLQGFLFAAFPGTALEFDGVDEYVNCGNDASLNITDAITIEAWINANSWGLNFWEGTIVGKDNTDKTGYNLRCGDNGSLSFVNGIAGAWPEAVSSQIMSVNEWYHVAGVYDGVSQKIYINGNLAGENTTTGTIGISSTDLQIGDSQGYAGRLFDGKIDEVRVWNVARTEIEIQDNMYSSMLGTETGLVAYYEFDEGTGATAGDSAGSNDGTLINMEEVDWVGSTISSPSVVLFSDSILFALITETFNSIDVGARSSSTFTDIDGDGLLDMLIGEQDGNINHYEQDEVNSTLFILITDSFNGIDVEYSSAPTFTDLDGDGLLDMLIGEYYGNIHHYEQDSENSTSFTLVTESFNGIDVGDGSAPTFTDLDGDGLLDMLIGETSGNINHYEQNEVNSTSFTLITETFNGIGASSYSTPTFTDLDGDDLLDMLIGGLNGNINYYEQDAANSTSFTLVTESFNGIDVGMDSAPTFTDLDGDGLLDMLIGKLNGNINHYDQESISEIDLGSMLIGSSSIESYIINAKDLTNDLNIDCTGEGYLISLSENTGYQSNISITPVNGTVLDTIFVRFEPAVKQEYIGNISHSSQNMETKDIALSGVGEAIDSIPGTALEFDGTDDYVNCGNDISLDITDSITIEAWINANSWKSNFWEGTIIGKDDNTAGYNLRCGENGRLSFVSGISGSWEEAVSSQIMNIGTWYHVAATYDGVSQKIYINGELVGENAVTGTIVTNTDSLQIGDSPGYPGRTFAGKIDEVRVWNTARTIEQIRESINLPLEGTEAGLVGYWQFNEGAGTTTSNIGYTGTLTNMEVADWVDSTIPFGSGTVNTQIVSATGIVNFAETDLSMDITEKTGTDTIVVTKIELTPNIIPSDVDDTFDNQYWVVRKYGTGTYNSNTTFKISEDLTIEDENKPNRIYLFSRDIGSDDDWYIETRSDSVDSSNDQAIFNEVNDGGQYILARRIKPHIEELYPQDDALDMIPNENLVIRFDQEMIVGSGNMYIKKSFDDTIFETISTSSMVISDSTVTIDPDFNFEYFTDYYVLIDSTAFMSVDSVCFNGIYDKETWNFAAKYTFTDINTGLVDAEIGSAIWGDYDNDGDLDILLTGSCYDGESYFKAAKIYNNDSGSFTDINAGLEGVYASSVAWGDYDNDGDLDILLIGALGAGGISRVYNNNSGIFTDIGAGLQDVRSGSVAWGDYDNDGDLDILLTGSVGAYMTSKIYNNDSGVFTDINAGLVDVRHSSVAWGDYDNDGDLDILLTGSHYDSGYLNKSKVYRNDSGIFTDVGAGLTDVNYSSVAWGDYDNDGDLDILLTGYYYDGSNNYVSKIYNNDSGIFTDINAELIGVRTGSVAWGDYDNDGDLDILLSGDTGTESTSKIYRNDSGVFTDIGAGLENVGGNSGAGSSSVAWGDYDNDGDLDILLTGKNGSDRVSKIYRNNSLITNTVPSSPINLSLTIIDSDITLSWDKATDTETPQDGLSYNLYLGTVDNKDSVNTSMSDNGTGYRKVASLGNANQNNSWTIKDLEGGTYYWSVQAVDHAFAGSEFSAEQTFSILGSPQNVTTEIIGSDIKLSWDAVPGAATYRVYASDDPYGVFENVTRDGDFLTPISWKIVYTGNKTFYYVIAFNSGKSDKMKKININLNESR